MAKFNKYGQVLIDGTYPFDGRFLFWQKVRDLSRIEACDLLSLPESLREKKDPDGSEACLFVNKGYVCFGVDIPIPSINPLESALLEAMGLEVCASRIPSGTQAVYNHDGVYILIERM